MASTAGAPKIASLRTIKSDVVVGLGDDGDTIAEKLDNEEPGWKISGKYVGPVLWLGIDCLLIPLLVLQGCRASFGGSSRGESALHLEYGYAFEWEDTISPEPKSCYHSFHFP
jgi:hypothetical protein